MRLAVLLLAISASVNCAYWLENVEHLGRSPYNPDPNYQVFRNVKDFGAVGDGVTDDTAAINDAINFGSRCQPGICKGTTIAPATVYFPSGTYLISSSIIDIYHTQLIGDPTSLPTIRAAPTFSNQSFGLIDANPYQPGGSLAWNSTNTFFRQISNFLLDTTLLRADFHVVGIHWPTAQATSISNCVFRLSEVPGNQHTGLFIEEGSGGLLSDLYFHGGGPAAVFGNQQYTTRNLWFFNADVAISMPWNWGWTYKSLYFRDCVVGIEMDPDQDSVGSVTLVDSSFENVDVGILTTRTTSGVSGTNGTLILDNVKFNNVNKALVGPAGMILDRYNILQGENNVFVMGHVVDGGGLYAETGYHRFDTSRPGRLLDGDKYYERSKPRYEDIPDEAFLSARIFDAQGDGSTDDTEALNAFFAYTAQNGYVAYLNAGIYLVTNTVLIPANARIVGESMASIIMATGSWFQDMSNPRPVVQVGQSGDLGYIEWSDCFVSTRGPCPGAVLIEYNLFTPTTSAPSGMWDVHVRVGGTVGTDLQLGQCPALKLTDGVNPNCIAAYMSMHITKSAGGLYSENCWLWVADHDLEDQLYQRVTLYAGRGMLVESERGRLWLSATASEHHVLYQYQLVGTREVYMGQVQTESPYFQPHPPAHVPFSVNSYLSDPDFVSECVESTFEESCETSWAMRIIESQDISVYGSGFYSFFDNYNDTCSRNTSPLDCQARLLSIEGDSSGVKFLGLNTLGTRVMVQQNGRDLVFASGNNSTFADSLALYIPQ